MSGWDQKNTYNIDENYWNKELQHGVIYYTVSELSITPIFLNYNQFENVLLLTALLARMKATRHGDDFVGLVLLY